MEDFDMTQRRAEAAEEGRLTKGPLGYREVGCATVSFCDEKGELIGRSEWRERRSTRKRP